MSFPQIAVAGNSPNFFTIFDLDFAMLINRLDEFQSLQYTINGVCTGFLSYFTQK